MVATAEDLLAYADSFAGFVEGPKNNETPFGAWAGANFQPWCHAFTSFCLDHVGLGIGKIVYCPTGVVYYRDRDRLFSEPKVGDEFYLWFPSKNRYAHTGFVRKVDGDWIVTREGNSNAAGSRTGGAVVTLRRKWRGTRTVFGRPAFGTAPPPQPEPQPPATFQEDLVICCPTFATVQPNGRIAFIELRPVDNDEFMAVLHNGGANTGVKLARVDGSSPSGLPFMKVTKTTGAALGPPVQHGNDIFVACVGSGVYKVGQKV